MKSKLFKTFLSIGLAAILSVTATGSPSLAAGGNAADDAEIKGKDEVIYAILTPNGSVRSMYAVNHFALAGAGSITDYGEYTSVTNLTDTAPIARDGDALTVQTGAENFYYQGNMAATELPWIFDISYALDGVKTAPQELAGTSGKLEIRIASTNNAAVTPAFYENYMLQITITLDTEKCSDIEAPGASVANAGKNKAIVYTVMPGKDAEISLSAIVRDFTMTGIDIAAMPFSMSVELPDMDKMTDDFTELSDAISDLNDGVGELADGAAELKTGAEKITSGSSDIKTGLSELSGNSWQLIQASAQIGGALTQIASSVNGALGEMELGDLAQLPQGLSQLADGLRDISGGLIALKNGFTPAYEALDQAIQGIPGAAITPEQIAALYAQTDPSQYALLGTLIDSYTAAQTVKGTYAQVKEAFDAVGPTMEALSASINVVSATLDDMSIKIGEALSKMDMMEQLAQLSAGLAELDRNYAAFHNGLKSYMDGVGSLSSGYADFHSGVSSMRDGVGELYGGVAELHDGTAELSDETAKMPDAIQSTIDDMLDQYTSSDFEPVSFTSPKNEHTDLVQFVLKCDGIEKPGEVKGVKAEAGDETFWDRLVSLFTGKKEG